MISDRFCLQREIGEGSFNRVYLATDLLKNSSVAIKITKTSSLRKNSSVAKTSSIESSILEVLTKDKCVGFPKLIWWGQLEIGSVIVMQLLGELLPERLNKQAPILFQLGPQMLSRLEQLHRLGIVHRDQKPSNWMFGRGPRSKVLHLIDFGLSDWYIKEDTHIEYNQSSKFYGTHLYSSPYPQLGFNQSRRDDLISLGYVLASFYEILPWYDTHFDPANQKKLADRKLRTSFGDKHPKGLVLYIEKCLSLDFYEDPPYDDLISLLS